MNIGRIFGTTFFSVLAALVLYDMFGRGIVEGLGKYDNTFEALGKNRNGDYVTATDENGNVKIYRIKSAA